MIKLDLIHRRLYDYRPGDKIHYGTDRTFDDCSVGVVESNKKNWVTIEAHKLVEKCLIFGVTKKEKGNEKRNEEI